MQNQRKMIQLPSEILEYFTEVYQGQKACRFTNMQEYKDFTGVLTRLGASFKTKIQKKPVSGYYVILIPEDEKPDYGSCDSCGEKLVEVSWCKHCGDLGWYGESFINKQGYWGV